MAEWIDISKAPKDGTIFDVWDSKYGRIVDCWMQDDFIVGPPEDGQITHFMIPHDPDGNPIYIYPEPPK